MVKMDTNLKYRLLFFISLTFLVNLARSDSIDDGKFVNLVESEFKRYHENLENKNNSYLLRQSVDGQTTSYFYDTKDEEKSEILVYKRESDDTGKNLIVLNRNEDRIPEVENKRTFIVLKKISEEENLYLPIVAYVRERDLQNSVELEDWEPERIKENRNLVLGHDSCYDSIFVTCNTIPDKKEFIPRLKTGASAEKKSDEASPKNDNFMRDLEEHEEERKTIGEKVKEVSKAGDAASVQLGRTLLTEKQKKIRKQIKQKLEDTRMLDQFLSRVSTNQAVDDYNQYHEDKYGDPNTGFLNLNLDGGLNNKDNDDLYAYWSRRGLKGEYPAKSKRGRGIEIVSSSSPDNNVILLGAAKLGDGIRKIITKVVSSDGPIRYLIDSNGVPHKISGEGKKVIVSSEPATLTGITSNYEPGDLITIDMQPPKAIDDSNTKTIIIKDTSNLKSTKPALQITNLPPSKTIYVIKRKTELPPETISYKLLSKGPAPITLKLSPQKSNDDSTQETTVIKVQKTLLKQTYSSKKTYKIVDSDDDEGDKEYIVNTPNPLSKVYYFTPGVQVEHIDDVTTPKNKMYITQMIKKDDPQEEDDDDTYTITKTSSNSSPKKISVQLDVDRNKRETEDGNEHRARVMRRKSAPAGRAISSPKYSKSNKPSKKRLSSSEEEEEERLKELSRSKKSKKRVPPSEEENDDDEMVEDRLRIFKRKGKINRMEGRAGIWGNWQALDPNELLSGGGNMVGGLVGYGKKKRRPSSQYFDRNSMMNYGVLDTIDPGFGPLKMGRGINILTRDGGSFEPSKRGRSLVDSLLGELVGPGSQRGVNGLIDSLLGNDEDVGGGGLLGGLFKRSIKPSDYNDAEPQGRGLYSDVGDGARRLSKKALARLRKNRDEEEEENLGEAEEGPTGLFGTGGGCGILSRRQCFSQGSGTTYNFNEEINNYFKNAPGRGPKRPNSGLLGGLFGRSISRDADGNIDGVFPGTGRAISRDADGNVDAVSPGKIDSGYFKKKFIKKNKSRKPESDEDEPPRKSSKKSKSRKEPKSEEDEDRPTRKSNKKPKSRKEAKRSEEDEENSGEKSKPKGRGLLDGILGGGGGGGLLGGVLGGGGGGGLLGGVLGGGGGGGLLDGVLGKDGLLGGVLGGGGGGGLLGGLLGGGSKSVINLGDILAPEDKIMFVSEIQRRGGLHRMSEGEKVVLLREIIRRRTPESGGLLSGILGPGGLNGLVRSITGGASNLLNSILGGGGGVGGLLGGVLGGAGGGLLGGVVGGTANGLLGGLLGRAAGKSDSVEENGIPKYLRDEYRNVDLFSSLGWLTEGAEDEDLEKFGKLRPSQPFVGFGSCNFVPLTSNALKTPSSNTVKIILYLTALRTQCNNETFVTLDEMSKAGNIKFKQTKKSSIGYFQLTPTFNLLKKSPLTSCERRRLYMAMEFETFTKTFAKQMKAKREPKMLTNFIRVKNANSKELEKSLFVTFRIYTALALLADFYEHPEHTISLTRNLVLTLKSTFIKSLEDYNRFSNCEKCTKVDKNYAYNNVFSIYGLQQFILDKYPGKYDEELTSNQLPEKKLVEDFNNYLDTNAEEIKKKLEEYFGN